MALIPLRCPHCGSEQVAKGDTTAAGKQRYRCQNEACSHRTFIRDCSYRPYLPEVKQQVVDMAVSGSGIRDTGRVLGVGKDTLVRILKKLRCVLPVGVLAEGSGGSQFRDTGQEQR